MSYCTGSMCIFKSLNDNVRLSSERDIVIIIELLNEKSYSRHPPGVLVHSLEIYYSTV